MDTLTVNATPPAITSNFATIREQLAKELESADIVVTEDTVADAKKKATEINKLRKEIDDRRKEHVKAMTAPIRDWENQAKELVAMCDEARAGITSQVSKFESKALASVRELMQMRLEQYYDAKGVRERFQVPLPAGIERLSYKLASGGLSAAGKKEAEQIVHDCLAKQQAEDIRLAGLEGECMKAGLTSALTEEHVRGILHLPDAEYRERLASLIDVQLIAQKKAQEAARAEVEAQQAEEALHSPPAQMADADIDAATQAENPSADMPVEEQAHVYSAPEPVEGQRVSFIVRLETNIPDGWTVAQVQSVLLKKLRDAGVEKSICRVDATLLSSQQQAA